MLQPIKRRIKKLILKINNYFMKHKLLILIVSILSSQFIYGQTQGELTVSTSTSSAGGNYSPRNIVAIWIEDDAGNFVKTLLAYANNRKTHLNTWQATTAAAGTEYNTVDAITGATKSSHATRTCVWNGEDYNASLMPDGEYKLWMELTDKNNTGNFSSFQFTKGESLVNLNPSNVPSFSEISIIWEPTSLSITNNIDNKKPIIFPNPSNGIFNIDLQNIEYVEVANLNGEIILKSKESTIDLSNEANGVYLIKIKSSIGISSHKFIKR